MVRGFMVVAAAVLGLISCSGDKLCPAGSVMKDGACRISAQTGDLDLVLPVPADVSADTPAELVETNPADTADIQVPEVADLAGSDVPGEPDVPAGTDVPGEPDVPAGSDVPGEPDAQPETTEDTILPEPSPDAASADVVNE